MVEGDCGDSLAKMGHGATDSCWEVESLWGCLIRVAPEQRWAIEGARNLHSLHDSLACMRAHKLSRSIGHIV